MLRNSGLVQLTIACTFLLFSGMQAGWVNQASAAPHRAHPRHATAPLQSDQSEADPGLSQSGRSAQESTEDSRQETASESRSNEESQSRRSSEDDYASPRQASAGQPGETLLSVLLRFVCVGLLIVFLGMIPAGGTAIVCAIVYHAGNALRGGKRPSIG
jgi:hypothetical protein